LNRETVRLLLRFFLSWSFVTYIVVDIYVWVDRLPQVRGQADRGRVLDRKDPNEGPCGPRTGLGPQDRPIGRPGPSNPSSAPESPSGFVSEGPLRFKSRTEVEDPTASTPSAFDTTEARLAKARVIAATPEKAEATG